MGPRPSQEDLRQLLERVMGLADAALVTPVPKGRQGVGHTDQIGAAPAQSIALLGDTDRFKTARRPISHIDDTRSDSAAEDCISVGNVVRTPATRSVGTATQADMPASILTA